MKVKDEHRTNPLSLEPGGGVVRVTFKNGKFRDYDKIKNPAAFINQIKKVGNDVQEATCIDWGEPDKGQYSDSE